MDHLFESSQVDSHVQVRIGARSHREVVRLGHNINPVGKVALQIKKKKKQVKVEFETKEQFVSVISIFG